VEGSSHCLTVVLSQHLLWGTEQCETSQPHQLVSGAGFEPGISQIWCRSATHSSVTFSVRWIFQDILICHGYCYKLKDTEILWKLCAVNEAHVRPYTALYTSHWYSNLCHSEPRPNWGTDSRVSLLSQKVCIFDFHI
jgi:hypothetical protein